MVLIKRIAFLFFFGWCFTNAFAQIVQNQFWADYNHSNRLKSGHILFGDIGYRFLDVGRRNNTRVNIRPGIQFRSQGNLKYQVGIGYFYFQNESILNAHEVRLFGGMQFEAIELGMSKLNHYIRFEAIHNWYVDNYLFPNVQMRLRYELGEDIQLLWFNVNATRWYVPIAFEPFVDIAFQSGRFNWITRIRITAGIGYNIGNNDAIELCYVYQETGVIIERIINVTNHAIRLRYYHKWN